MLGAWLLHITGNKYQTPEAILEVRLVNLAVGLVSERMVSNLAIGVSDQGIVISDLGY